MKMSAIPQIQIQSTPVKFEGAKNRGELSIDQYPSRYSYNIKTLTDLMRDTVSSAKQTVQNAIGRIAANGDRMSEVGNGATVAAITVEEAQPTPVAVEYVSIDRPEIRYTVTREPGIYEPGRLDISV